MKSESVRCSVVFHSDLMAPLLCPWNSLGKVPGVGCHSFLQIFCTQDSKQGLLHYRQITV